MECIYCHSLAPRMAVGEFKPFLGTTVLRGVCNVCTPEYETGKQPGLSNLTPVLKRVMNPDRMPQINWDRRVLGIPIPVPAVYRPRC